MEVLSRNQAWITSNGQEKLPEAKAPKPGSAAQTKQKRKAPPVPPGEPPLRTTADSGGNKPLQNGKNRSVNNSAISGWSSSASCSTSADFSPSSNSYSTSSLSESAARPTQSRHDTRNHSRSSHSKLAASEPNLIAASDKISKSKDYSSTNSLSGKDPTTAKKPAVAKKPSSLKATPVISSTNGLDKTIPLSPPAAQGSKAADCSNISEYVENAILVSSNSNLMAPSPAKSDDGPEAALPPRLWSFESSSNLHHDDSLKVAPENSPAPVKLDYVSLDFVRSAAAEGRHRKRDHDDSSRRSNSSLSSSLISSVDSEEGSIIGSDVVENLYNKITEAAARRSSRNSLNQLSPDKNTGEIEKDLFPLIFPGHREKQSDDVQVDGVKASTAASADDTKHNSNFNNNNSSPAANSVVKSDATPFFANDKQSLQVRTCPDCSGVITDETDADMDASVARAKELFGQCMCGDEREEITEIDYCSANLKEVPSDIWDYAETLTTLLVESNTITELPNELFSCQKLKYLSVSDNDIGLIPPALASLIDLQHLDVSKNVIEVVPECIRCCKNLQVLDASVNPIERLSEGFTQLMSLKELYMNDCFFEFLPANFGRMSQLMVLELRDNQLQTLPKSIRRLTQLSRLDLGGNIFQEWPDVICELTNLTELWFDCNELSKLPLNIGELSRLKYLDLSRNFLESIPNQLGSLENLTDLLLGENSLTYLPDSIGFLEQLAVLNLESNQLSAVPDSIGRLRAMEELVFSHNKLETVPSTIGNLRSLHTLLLDDNRLMSIPVDIGSCSSLKILQINGNQIDRLPQSVGDLIDLRVFNICQNRLPHLPISMNRLMRITALWITPNQSKPKVPLQTKVNEETGQRILTNMLFPQKDKGFNRPNKLLSILDDDDSYANDAADDDDPVLYAQRPRGQTHVVFNLDATTYSTDVLGDVAVESEDDVIEDIIISADTNKLSEDAKKMSPNKPDHEAAVRNEYAVDVPGKFEPTGLSVRAHSPDVQHNDDKPTVKTANILRVKLRDGDDADEQQASSKLKEDQGNLRLPVTDTAGRSSDEESLPPGGSRGIRAWTSHSHLPAISTLEGKDSEIPVVEQRDVSSVPGTITPDSLRPTNGDIEKEAAAKPPMRCEKEVGHARQESPESGDLLGRLEQLTRIKQPTAFDENTTVAPTKAAVLPGAAKGHAPPSTAVVTATTAGARNSKKGAGSGQVVPEEPGSSVPTLGNIPFMDEEYQKRSDDAPRATGHDVIAARNDRKMGDGAEAAKSSVASKPETVTGGEHFTLSADFVLDGKSSSVTSGEMSVDSGVGNDVESQESIPDAHEEGSELGALSGKQHRGPGLAQPLDQAALRRNKGGWIALVSTDKQRGQEPDASEPHYATPKGASRYNADTASKSQLQFVPNVPAEMTTVSYSSEYKLDAQTAAPAKQKSSSKDNNNKVSDNIKKFEKFFEDEYPAARRPSVEIGAVSSSTIKVGSQPVSTGSTHSLKEWKPQAPATKPNGSTVAAKKVNIADAVTTRPTESKSKSAPGEVAKTRPALETTPLVPDSRATTVSRDSQLMDEIADFDRQWEQLSLRRQSSHQRKSKFEEALAATKHKHFRDKLEKMMQQKAPLTAGGRSSRASISSIASIPRITSPVPRALSPHADVTPLEHLTAEDTFSPDRHGQARPGERFPKSQQPVHERLKEKLNTQHLDTGTTAQTSPSSGSRPRPGSVNSRPFRRGSVHRSSVKSLGGYDPDGKDDAEADPKKSIEEQLGKLLLDGSTSPGREKGFVPYGWNPSSRTPRHGSQDDQQIGMSHQPPPALRSLTFNPGAQRPALPVDWKDQLLRHIQRKKNEKQEVSAVRGQPGSYQQQVHRNDARSAAPFPHDVVSSAASSAPGEANRASKNFARGSERRRSLTKTSDTPGVIADEHRRNMSRSRTAPEVGDASAARNRGSLVGDQSDFVRSSGAEHGRQGGRRSSGRFLRTRTPGPESTSTSNKEVIVRPKSAMDMPTTNHFLSQDQQYDVWNTQEVPQIQKPRAMPAAAPPSYEDHMLRRVAPPSGKSGPNYNDYVNIEYVDQLRASGRKKKHSKSSTMAGHAQQLELQAQYPIRSTGSHESILNAKMEKAYAHDLPAANVPVMRGSNSHDSIVDHRPQQLQPYPNHAPAHLAYHQQPQRNPSISRAPYPYEPIDYRQHNRRESKKHYQYYPEPHAYGVIPAPSKTRAPKIPPRDHAVHKSRDRYPPHDDYVHLPDRKARHDGYYAPPAPAPAPAFPDDYDETLSPLSPSLQRNYGDRDEESVASAFRPYHQKQVGHHSSQHAPLQKSTPNNHPYHQPYDDRVAYHQPRHNLIDHHRHHHHLDRGSKRDPHRYPPERSQPHHYPPPVDDELSAGSEQSLSGELSRHWREADAAAELVTVTVMKNPTFGFHIMGGIDAGGNPYRHDDDGVFITYVAPGGAADSQVEPGDKILMVNGSDFVGITHKRAVDLLRNAGQVAVLVVERIVGRAV